MRGLSFALVTSAAAIGLTFVAPKTPAQVEFGVNIGPAPDCPYMATTKIRPMTARLMDIYGPECFDNGVFIGAGPWFRGPRGLPWPHR